MKVRCGLAVLLVCGIGGSAAADVDGVRLRASISLPRISANVQFNLHVSEEGDEQANPDLILKSLKGDVGDVDVYMQAAAAYSATKLSADKSHELYQKAAPMLRAILEKSPQDGWAMSRLGVSLQGASREPDVEAEKWLRNAVKVSATDWRCWANLGDYVQSAALSTAFGSAKDGPVNYNDPAELQRRIQTLSGHPDIATRAAALLEMRKEAETLFDKAVSLAPSNAASYNRRFGYRFLDHVCTENILKVAHGENQDYSQLISDSALEDKWKAADLKPDDAVLNGSAVIYQLLSYTSRLPAEQASGRQAILAKLTSAGRDHVEKGLARLSSIANGKDTVKATRAFVFESSSSVLLADYPAAIAAATSALKLDPESLEAAQGLDASYVATHQFSELVTALREQIKRSDSAFRRLFLVKSFAAQGKRAEELDELKAALIAFPDDLLLNVAMANEMMKTADTDALKKAGDCISKAQVRFDKLDASQKQDMQSDFNISRGIYLALIGKPDVARSALQWVLSYDPTNIDAKSALDALGAP